MTETMNIGLLLMIPVEKNVKTVKASWDRP